MPGTPPTTPRFGAPRVANTDTFDMARDHNGLADALDVAARVDTGTAAGRPATSVANGFYYATDTRQLSRWNGTGWDFVAPGAHASTHQDGAADPLTVREAMMATGGLGMAKGSFSAYRAAAQALASAARVDFDTEEWDVSNWLLGGVYTPQIAGWYHFSWIAGTSTAMTVDNYFNTGLYKNGTRHRSGSFMNFRTAAAGVLSVGNARAQANGTTDAFDIRILHNNGGTVAIFTGSTDSHFSGQFIGRS